MPHESWTGTFIQGMIMGMGMMVPMGVAAAARVIAGRARRGARPCAPTGPTKQSGRHAWRRGDACVAPTYPSRAMDAHPSRPQGDSRAPSRGFHRGDRDC
jgi:hypothetical protein